MSAGNLEHLRLKAENFGPIAKADVELRPLTVFVGPSGSGKSYLARLLYALHQSFGGRRALRRHRWRSTHFLHRTSAKIDLHLVADWLEEYVYSEEVEDRVEPPDDVAMLAREAVKLPDVGSVFFDELLRVFGAEVTSDLILIPPGEPHMTPNRSARLRLSHRVSDGRSDPAQFCYAFTITARKSFCELDVSEGAPIRLERSGSYWQRALQPGFFQHQPPDSADRAPINQWRLKRVLADLAQPGTVGPISRPAHYLPAGRSGGVEVQQAVMESLLDRATRARHAGQTDYAFSGVLSDYWRDMFIRLRDIRPSWTSGQRLAMGVEQAILKGVVRVREAENGATSWRYRPDQWEEDLPLARASSMVTEMIPLVLYLRHYAQPSSTLIIEEPEAHMHPAMQVQFAVALARMVEAGLRVVITVHSEWILSALANVCRMGALPEGKREGLFLPGVELPADQVGIWEFFPNGEGASETRELRLDSDDGMFEAGYPHVAEALYDDWATIHSRLQED